MIPNVYIPPIYIFSWLPIEPFGVAVAAAVLVGYLLGQRRARVVGLDRFICADTMFWALVSGFVGAHLVSMVFYFPEEIVKNPLVLLYIWAGISSVGGFIGGTIGGIVFLRRIGASPLKYADAIVFGFVPAWILGRLGCTIVFDHPGYETEFVLGMADRLGVVRHNLGFYELLFAVAMSLILLVLRRVRWFDGFFVALTITLYAPVRFLLDYLRTKDELYWGLTPAQFASIAALGFAAWLWLRGLSRRDESSPHKKPTPENNDAPSESTPNSAEEDI